MNYHGQQKSTGNNEYQPISTNIKQYQPISTNINQYQAISTNINQYQAISSNINWLILTIVIWIQGPYQGLTHVNVVYIRPGLGWGLQCRHLASCLRDGCSCAMVTVADWGWSEKIGFSIGFSMIQVTKYIWWIHSVLGWMILWTFEVYSYTRNRCSMYVYLK